jgi:tRNA (adenine22-N1)-methyltransferase
LFLLSEGLIERAVCSDVNRGPLDTAEANAKALGFFDKIDFVLADGASVLADRGISDMAICGMGGELIADIILKAPFIKTDKVRLILQPMSKQAHLRRFLAKEGFYIREEKYSSEEHRNYVCILAEYDGKERELTPLEAEIGRAPYTKSDSALLGYIKDRISSLEKAVNGKRLCGTASLEEETLTALQNVLKNLSLE